LHIALTLKIIDLVKPRGNSDTLEKLKTSWDGQRKTPSLGRRLKDLYHSVVVGL
jgi:hypothetical protein